MMNFVSEQNLGSTFVEREKVLKQQATQVKPPGEVEAAVTLSLFH